jgi:hypothetical protein
MVNDLYDMRSTAVIFILIIANCLLFFRGIDFQEKYESLQTQCGVLK